MKVITNKNNKNKKEETPEILPFLTVLSKVDTCYVEDIFLKKKGKIKTRI